MPNSCQLISSVIICYVLQISMEIPYKSRKFVCPLILIIRTCIYSVSKSHVKCKEPKIKIHISTKRGKLYPLPYVRIITIVPQNPGMYMLLVWRKYEDLLGVQYHAYVGYVRYEDASDSLWIDIIL